MITLLVILTVITLISWGMCVFTNDKHTATVYCVITWGLITNIGILTLLERLPANG